MTDTTPAQVATGKPRRSGLWLTAGLAVSLAWAGAATYVIAFHDEALARVVSGQMAMRKAYEARIAGLQDRIEGTKSERAAAEADLAARVQAALDRQAELERRQAALADLIDVSTTGAIPRAGMRPLAPFPAPVSPAAGTGRRSALDAEDGLIRLDARLGGIQEAQEAQLGRLAAGAQTRLARLREVILRTGLDPSRFVPATPGDRVGGPFVALDPITLGTGNFDGGLALAEKLLGDDQRMRRIVGDLPLRRPLGPGATPSSPFGPRLDPFTRGLALHTGLDLKAEYGEPARATAPGIVSGAEWAGGYGNMVEIDHGHGLATRFGHLSRIAVRPGQRVAAGDVIGYVGSTGRSTGAHLHYETRIDGEPVDPQRFLDAGRALDGRAGG